MGLFIGMPKGTLQLIMLITWKLEVGEVGVGSVKKVGVGLGVRS